MLSVPTAAERMNFLMRLSMLWCNAGGAAIVFIEPGVSVAEYSSRHEKDGRLPLFRSPEETFCDYSCAAVSDPCIIKDKAATRFRKPRRILI